MPFLPEYEKIAKEIFDEINGMKDLPPNTCKKPRVGMDEIRRQVYPLGMCPVDLSPQLFSKYFKKENSINE